MRIGIDELDFVILTAVSCHQSVNVRKLMTEIRVENDATFRHHMKKLKLLGLLDNVFIGRHNFYSAPKDWKNKIEVFKCYRFTGPVVIRE